MIISSFLGAVMGKRGLILVVREIIICLILSCCSNEVETIPVCTIWLARRSHTLAGPPASTLVWSPTRHSSRGCNARSPPGLCPTTHFLIATSYIPEICIQYITYKYLLVSESYPFLCMGSGCTSSGHRYTFQYFRVLRYKSKAIIYFDFNSYLKVAPLYRTVLSKDQN